MHFKGQRGPSYLLSDTGFWFFTVFYVVSVGIATALIVLPSRRMFARPAIGVLPGFVLPLFTVLLVYQFFHQAEHVTQMYQFQFLGFTVQESHGFVWFLDEEWNHFVFNVGYMLGIGVIFSFLMRALKRDGIPYSVGSIGLMVVFLVMEGWHCVEHTYRLLHHIQGLCVTCSGIVDGFFGINRLLYHFWMNFLALVLPLAVYVWFGLHRRIAGALQRKTAPAPLLATAK
jgi:hypothetical protein